MAATSSQDAIVTLAEEYPDWHVWRGRSGNRLIGWYATRRRKISNWENRSGLYRTLAADNPRDLRAHLEQQRAAEERLTGGDG